MKGCILGAHYNKENAEPISLIFQSNSDHQTITINKKLAEYVSPDLLIEQLVELILAQLQHCNTILHTQELPTTNKAKQTTPTQRVEESRIFSVLKKMR